MIPFLSLKSFTGKYLSEIHAAVARVVGSGRLLQGAAPSLAGKKIRVNSIAPAMVNTPLIDFSSLTEEQIEANKARYPLKRYGEPEDVANAALYLLSDASSWMTGQQIVLDGGLTIKAG